MVHKMKFKFGVRAAFFFGGGEAGGRGQNYLIGNSAKNYFFQVLFTPLHKSGAPQLSVNFEVA